MKKSKIALLLVVVAATTALFVGCKKETPDPKPDSSVEQKQDEVDEVDEVEEFVYDYEKEGENGTAIIKLTYEGDKPVDLFIDYIQKDKTDTKRVLCEKGEYIMKEGEEFDWAEQVDQLTTFIKDNNFDLTKVVLSEDSTTDVVTSVSIKVNEYVEAVQEAMDKIAAKELTATGK